MVGAHISFKIAHESDDVELLECAPGEGLRVCPSRGACDGACLRLRLQTLQLRHAKAEQRDQEGHEHPQRLLRQPGRDRLLMSIMRRRRP